MEWQNIAGCKWRIDDQGCLEIAPQDATTGLLELEETFERAPHLWEWPWLKNKEDIKTAIIRPGVKAGDSLSSLFDDCSNLLSVDLSGIDSSNVADMSRMFKCCTSLTEIVLADLDTSNVMDMSFMFAWCESLVSADLSAFDLSNILSIQGMFAYCRAAVTIRMPELAIEDIWNVRGAFYVNRSLQYLDFPPAYRGRFLRANGHLDMFTTRPKQEDYYALDEPTMKRLAAILQRRSA